MGGVPYRSQSQKLDEVLSTMTIAEAARRLSAVSGNEVGTERRNIYRWWKEGVRMSNDRAAQADIAFEKRSGHFRADSRVVPDPIRLARVEAEVRELGEKMDRILVLLEPIVDALSGRAPNASRSKRGS
jgi:hypothetical protein